MWSEGTIGIPDAADKNKYTACHYWVKHYDEPSEIYGLNKGKISKLMIKINGTVAQTTTEAGTSSPPVRKQSWRFASF
jgi:hypothetical protein